MISRMDSVIDMADISKTYSGGRLNVEALRGVTLKVLKGEFISVTGPSGSGKSTLLNILGCLDRPTSGRYLLSGTDILGMNQRELSRARSRYIGFVFQSFNLLSRLTALANVELPMLYANIPSRLRRARAEAALDRVGLSDRMTHRPAELSGGQRQRVAIARSLVNDPALILADEPTGNLDTAAGESIMSLFRSLNLAGSTIIIITHENQVSRVTDRIITFRDGKIVEDRPNTPIIPSCGETPAAERKQVKYGHIQRYKARRLHREA